MRYKLRKRILLPKVSPSRQKRLSTGIILVLLGFMFISGFYLLDIKIRPAIKYLAEAKVKQAATQAINEAINIKIAPDIKYENIIHINFDNDGKVAFMQPNTAEINRISAKATLAVQDKIKDLPSQTIRLPLEQLFGLKIFTGFGPKLPVKIKSIGIVESAINDRFDTAGINQIRHRIMVNIKSTIKITAPLVYQEFGLKTSVLLTEAIVMGQVPHIYVNSGGLIVPQDSR